MNSIAVRPRKTTNFTFHMFIEFILVWRLENFHVMMTSCTFGVVVKILECMDGNYRILSGSTTWTSKEVNQFVWLLHLVNYGLTAAAFRKDSDSEKWMSPIEIDKPSSLLRGHYSIINSVLAHPHVPMMFTAGTSCSLNVFFFANLKALKRPSLSISHVHSRPLVNIE